LVNGGVLKGAESWSKEGAGLAISYGICREWKLLDICTK